MSPMSFVSGEMGSILSIVDKRLEISYAESPSHPVVIC